jgi:hypothetical protein
VIDNITNKWQGSSNPRRIAPPCFLAHLKVTWLRFGSQGGPCSKNPLPQAFMPLSISTGALQPILTALGYETLACVPNADSPVRVAAGKLKGPGSGFSSGPKQPGRAL